MVGRHCDDGVLNFFIIEQKTKKQLELKTDNNNTRYKQYTKILKNNQKTKH